MRVAPLLAAGVLAVAVPPTSGCMFFGVNEPAEPVVAAPPPDPTPPRADPCGSGTAFVSVPEHIEAICGTDEIVLGCGLTISLEIPTLAGLECLVGISGSLTFDGRPEDVRLQDLRGLDRVEWIGGGLEFRDAVPAVGDLRGLESLREVGWNLRLPNVPMESLAGLEALESVGETLRPSTLSRSLAGLEALISVGSLELSYAQGLEEGVVLPALETIEQDLVVRWAAGLTELRLPGLRSVPSVMVESSPGLEVLDLGAVEALAVLRIVGVEALATVSLDAAPEVGTLLLADLPALTATDPVVLLLGAPVTVSETGLAALPLLNTPGSLARVLVEGNPALADISGLAGVRVVADLEIEDNPQLESLAGLEGLETGLRIDLRRNGLTSLAALGALEQATRVAIEHEPLLEVWDGLAAYASGSLVVQGCPSLLSITGSPDFVESEGVLIRDNASLVDVLGFDGLASVTNDLFIDRNDALRRVEGFGGLSSVGRRLRIGVTAQLETIGGFSTLTQVGADATIGGPAVTSFTGFGSLETVGGDLVLEVASGAPVELPRLLQIAGRLSLAGFDDFSTFAPLQGLTGLTVTGGAAITLDPLSAPATLTRGLVIEDTTALTDLGALEGVQTVWGGVRIERNAALQELDPLHGIGGMTGSLTVRDNPVLAPAEVDDLVDAIGATNVGGSVVTSGNGTGL